LLAFDLIADRATVAIGSWAIYEALLDQSAGQGVELRHSARAGNCAARHPSIYTDGEDKSDRPTDPSFAQMTRNVAGRDFSRDLLEIAAALVAAVAFTADATARP
jgi:hypothetical protein